MIKFSVYKDKNNNIVVSTFLENGWKKVQYKGTDYIKAYQVINDIKNNELNNLEYTSEKALDKLAELTQFYKDLKCK